MTTPRAPNFFIAGTGKAGTTSLYRYLRQHPQIYMSPVKEPGFFASEIRHADLSPALLRYLRLRSGKQVPGQPQERLYSSWQEYLKLFQDATNEVAVGEATPAYLWSETAAANISARIPDAKIIMMLRDPAERAFSQYLHQVAVGLVSCSFREHVEHCLANRDRTFSAYYPFLEVGLYRKQVQRYFDLFPRDSVRIYWYEEDWREPARLLADIFQFLGVDPSFSADTSRKALERRAPRFPFAYHLAMRLDITHRFEQIVPGIWRAPIRKLLFKRGTSLKMEAADRRFLIEYYRDDIRALGSMLNRDLTAWLRV